MASGGHGVNTHRVIVAVVVDPARGEPCWPSTSTCQVLPTPLQDTDDGERFSFTRQTAERRTTVHVAPCRTGQCSRVFWALGDCHVMRSRRRATVAEAVSIHLHSSVVITTCHYMTDKQQIQAIKSLSHKSSADRYTLSYA